jgi:hypothetical protein
MPMVPILPQQHAYGYILLSKKTTKAHMVLKSKDGTA